HQLTATALGQDIVHGHGVRGGKAMIATLRRRLIAVPGRLIRHARHLILRLPPGHGLLHEVLARLRALPAPCLTCASSAPAPVLAHGLPAPPAERPRRSRTRRRSRAVSMPAAWNPGTPSHLPKTGSAHRAIRGFGSERIN